MIEPLFAGFVLALCVVALARLALGARRRARLDAALQRSWMRLTRRLTRRGATTAQPAARGRHAAGAGPGPAAQPLRGTLKAQPPAAGRTTAGTGGGLVGLWRRMRQRAAQREAEKRAAREAEALIRRARDGHWEGNVYRPTAFDARNKRRSEAPGRGPSDTLH
ncbi:MAG: hypothetical protein HZB72_04175 [Burkholderiales bacterium]|nr:hypothetical protein [Burkholderiales bacterium]